MHILNFLLFSEQHSKTTLKDGLKYKINLRHKINHNELKDNCENELFTLNFSDYKKLFLSCTLKTMRK